MNSIMQDWTTTLGLRHQGVLVAAIRGCDSAHREDASKWISRFYRGCVLKPHCGDVRQASSFMLWCDDPDEWFRRSNLFFESIDHYPNHFILHLMHAAGIVGSKTPDCPQRRWWADFYQRMVRKFHLHPETEAETDARLGVDEKTFAQQQQ